MTPSSSTNPFRIVDPQEPDLLFGLWRERVQPVRAVFAAEPGIAEIAFEMIQAVEEAGNRFPTSCRFRYYDHDGEELSVSILAMQDELAGAAWHFEQSFLPLLEDTMFQFSLADPLPAENTANAVWSFIFRRGWQFWAQPYQHDCPKITPLFEDSMTGHEKIAAVAWLEDRWNGRKAFKMHRDPRHRFVSMAAHDARVTGLINYASEQVTRRRNLSNGIRTLIDSGILDDARKAELEALIAANGPI